MIELFEKYRSNIPVELSDSQIDKFIKFYDLLIEKNKVMNLTAIVEPEEVMLKHFIDSLMISNLDENILQNARQVIDVGTGAGFPGIPLAIAYPDIQFTLLDSLNKRLLFINEVCEICDIRNVATFHTRAEDAGHHQQYREQFDICVSRAVANLSVLLEYCTPLIKVNGKFISYKSGEVEDEVQQANTAMKKLNVELNQIKHFILPMTDIKRSFIIFNKRGHTDRKYPRQAGKITKNPL